MPLLQALKINIIGKSNGVGLARDLKLLSEGLQACGHDVAIRSVEDEQAKRRRSVFTQWTVRAALAWSEHNASGSRRARADVNLMLEHVWPEHLSMARLNIAVPNPEWFDRHDQRFLSKLDCIWAKTAATDRVFRALGCNTALVGFDSEDRHLPGVPRERTFFHLAGKSTMKGTDRLLHVWARNPRWPKLIVVQHRSEDHEPQIKAGNIERHTGYLDDTELKILQNKSIFHICLSRTEGWGHYIAEALSVGAVTLTVDAPPMNNIVTSERGLLVPYSSTGVQRLATTYSFDEDGLQSAVEQSISMGENERTRIAAKARSWFLDNREGFPARLQAALLRLAAQNGTRVTAT